MSALAAYIHHQVYGLPSALLLMGGLEDDEVVMAMMKRTRMTESYRICHRLCRPAANTNSNKRGAL